jgi:hypothetical protein
VLRKHIGQENYGRVNEDEHGEECRMDIDGERCSTKVGCEMMELHIELVVDDEIIPIDIIEVTA